MFPKMITRRGLLAGTAALTASAAASPLLAETLDPNSVRSQESVRRNTSSFESQDWRDHFDTLGKATIVCDTVSRALHFWSGDGSTYKVYPTSVPLTDEMKRTGYTKIVRKRVGPDWTPTASMIKRDPSLHYMPPGPDNPLGTHAMYLSWPAYLIHGTHDTRKIGRRSSSGCIGTYNELIAELFELTPIGTQVRVI